jgi:hypothetical protein
MWFEEKDDDDELLSSSKPLVDADDDGAFLLSIFSLSVSSNDGKESPRVTSNEAEKRSFRSRSSWRDVLSASLGPSRGVSPVLASVDIRAALLAILLRGVSGGDNHVATAVTDREDSRHVTAWEFDSVFCRVFRRSEEPKLEQVLSL